MEYTFQSKITSAASNSQGVTTDGSNYYLVDDNNIFKYDTTGSLVLSVVASGYGSGSHLADCTFANGKLWVLSNNYPASPKRGYVMEIDVTTLGFIDETQLFTDQWASAITYHDASFWVTNDDENKVFEYSPSFSLISSYDIPVNVWGSHMWNGITWDGDGNLLLNLHEGSMPDPIVKLSFDGLDFTLDDYIRKPWQCGQGMEWDDSSKHMVFAYRSYFTSIPDGIIVATLEPYDHRHEVVIVKDDQTLRSTSSTSYTTAPGLAARIAVRQGDVVEASLQGLFKVASGSIRAYAHESTGVGSIEIVPSPSIRTQVTSAESSTYATTRYLVALETGILQVDMDFRSVGGGLVYADDRTLTLRIVKAVRSL